MCVTVDMSKIRRDRMGSCHLGDRLEAKAKQLWVAAGCPSGLDVEFWNDAEREIIGYTKEEFEDLYELYGEYQDFFYDAPILLCWTEEQIEALEHWGYQSWQLWTLPDSPTHKHESFPFSHFDFSKRRYKTVAELFDRMLHVCNSANCECGWPFK